MSTLDAKNIAKYVGNCASLAALLEVSAYPKPGNVHRISNFQRTFYEHFLAGGVALGSVMGELAKRSINSKKWVDIRLGHSIYEAVDEMFYWQSGGNIHLGIILLLAPLSAGAGATLSDGTLEVTKLREYTKNIVSKATYEDTLAIYRAIERSMSLENLGSAEDLDIKNKMSTKKIKLENITPLEIFEICKNKDLICYEWVTGFSTIFETGYPYLKEKIFGGTSINNAIVDTFVNILSKNPDSLIIRKRGEKVARSISKEAQKILEMGGSESDDGTSMLWSLDEKLKKENGKLNPGTTADLTAASIFVLLLSGWKP